MAALVRLKLSSEPGEAEKNLFTCYVELNRLGVVPSEELALVEAWIIDLALARKTAESLDR